MPLKPSQINTYLLFKLPSAFLCGVRLRSISEANCTTTVRYRWINQNPFKSMFWAVQGMAAELSTGALVMSYIKERDASVSMLVANYKGSFSKKAKGKITFTCNDGLKIKQAIDKTLSTGEGVTCWMHSEGLNAQGEQVSSFDFEWTVKRKN